MAKQKYTNRASGIAGNKQQPHRTTAKKTKKKQTTKGTAHENTAPTTTSKREREDDQLWRWANKNPRTEQGSGKLNIAGINPDAFFGGETKRYNEKRPRENTHRSHARDTHYTLHLTRNTRPMDTAS